MKKVIAVFFVLLTILSIFADVTLKPKASYLSVESFETATGMPTLSYESIIGGNFTYEARASLGYYFWDLKYIIIRGYLGTKFYFDKPFSGFNVLSGITLMQNSKMPDAYGASLSLGLGYGYAFGLNKEYTINGSWEGNMGYGFGNLNGGFPIFFSGQLCLRLGFGF